MCGKCVFYRKIKAEKIINKNKWQIRLGTGQIRSQTTFFSVLVEKVTIIGMAKKAKKLIKVILIS